MNNDDYLAWSLQTKASNATEKIIEVVENHLAQILDQGVVSCFDVSIKNPITDFEYRSLSFQIPSSIGTPERAASATTSSRALPLL